MESIHFRLPKELRAQLEAQAAKESRSLSNLIVLLLKQGLEGK